MKQLDSIIFLAEDLILHQAILPEVIEYIQHLLLMALLLEALELTNIYGQELITLIIAHLSIIYHQLMVLVLMV